MNNNNNNEGGGGSLYNDDDVDFEDSVPSLSAPLPEQQQQQQQHQSTRPSRSTSRRIRQEEESYLSYCKVPILTCMLCSVLIWAITITIMFAAGNDTNSSSDQNNSNWNNDGVDDRTERPRILQLIYSNDLESGFQDVNTLEENVSKQYDVFE
jgi:hypothetical protein